MLSATYVLKPLHVPSVALQLSERMTGALKKHSLRIFFLTEINSWLFVFQIVLSGSASVAENQPRGTKVGTFSSVDPNSKDNHSYSIVSGGSGKFELRGADLLTKTSFNYESSPNRYA